MVIASRRSVLLIWAAGLSISTGVMAAEPPDSARQAEVMAAQMAAARPGPEHEMLASLAGSWETEVKFWVRPGAEAMLAQGTVENRMILGGRFLESRSQGTIAGAGVESLHIFGFDRRSSRFTLTAFDTEGTYSVSGAGAYDPKTKTITLAGEDEDPITGVVQQYDVTLEILSRDSYRVSVILKNPELTPGPDTFKVTEVTCTRAQQP